MKAARIVFIALIVLASACNAYRFEIDHNMGKPTKQMARLPTGAGYSVDEEPYYRNIVQPKTLDDAVGEIRQMISEGRPRILIAQRVAIIADTQVTNANDKETLSVSKKHWLLLPLRKIGLEPQEKSSFNTEKERIFNKWRQENNGAERDYETTAKWVWNSRYGQCAENAALVYYILKKAGAKDLAIFNVPKHRFVTWGMDPEADYRKRDAWTEDVIVPDSWQHVTLTGTDAWSDGLTGSQGIDLNDHTHMYDKTVKQRCGFTATGCCKRLAQCKSPPNLVCLTTDNKCHPCGRFNQACCANETCDSGLTCVSGKCVNKTDSCGRVGDPCCPGDKCLDEGDICVMGYCFDAFNLGFKRSCHDQDDCDKIHDCIDGTCVMKCNTNGDCEKKHKTYKCFQGHCISETQYKKMSSG